MKVTEIYPIIYLDFPVKRTYFPFYIGATLWSLLTGFSSLIQVLVEKKSIISIIGFIGVGFVVLGILFLFWFLKIVTTPDSLCINQDTNSITRIFGSNFLYDNLKNKKLTYDISSVSVLFLRRKIRLSETLSGSQAPLFHLICGLQDSEGKELLLHAGYRDSIETVKYLANSLKTDIVDYTGHGKRKILYNRSASLDEVRYYSKDFLHKIIFSFGIICTIFSMSGTLPWFMPYISVGILRSLLLQLGNIALLTSVILFVLFSIWVYKQFPVEKLKCKQCGTQINQEEASCSY
ncbi:MAG: hypothetical protein ACW98I_16530 [Candidatus Hodarchaeales archaeon]|jgi:hypothetical protein